MTRRDSLGDLESDVDELEETRGTGSFADYWRAYLKTVDDVDLTADEERLLEDPERHLSAEGWRELQEWRATVRAR